jgi:type VI secretion system secreted protein VgrG
MCARYAGIKLVSAGLGIEFTAVQRGIHLLAKVDITQTANGSIRFKAKEEIEVNGGGSYTRWNAAGIDHGTNGAWVEHAGSHGMEGPRSVPVPDPVLPRPSLATGRQRPGGFHLSA